jgi:hypothetical protein
LPDNGEQSPVIVARATGMTTSCGIVAKPAIEAMELKAH